MDLTGLADATTQKFHAAVAKECPCVLRNNEAFVLEEFEFRTKPGAPDPTEVATWIANCLLPNRPEYAGTLKRFMTHLVVLHDDDFTHFARYATEVTARIKLNYDTKTVSEGALFYQEFLPAEALMYAVVPVNQARGRAGTKADILFDRLHSDLVKAKVLQIGGDETTGKGYCGVRLTAGTGGGK